MRKISFIKSIIFYLIWICLNTGSAIAADANLLFKSGFEGSVEIVPWQTDYTKNDKIVGSDQDFTWPDDLPGTGAANFFNYLISEDKDNRNYIQTEIINVSGHHGNPTKALYQAVKMDDPDHTAITRNMYNMYPSSSRNFEQMYVRYWIKFQSNLDTIMPENSWRMIMEWHESGDDYRFNLQVIKLWYGGKPVWRLKGQKLIPIKEDDWVDINDQIDVPIGDWFLLEVFWNHSSSADGQVLVKVNGAEIFNHIGRNKLDSDLSVFAPFKCYGRTDYYQWIDDFEIWDNLPEIKTLQPPKNIRISATTQ